ncbi:g13083 [Coccomyxa viridis]|uniref:G13083 protein n=1 Tax=Coccomyxa viridis TaxID=1274662 RepID=A0ABP1GEJ0_9CHLO
MEPVSFLHQGTGEERYALRFGNQKINLHFADNIPDANVKHATPGSGDLCFIVEDSVEDLARELGGQGVRIILGPCQRTGAIASLRSIYMYGSGAAGCSLI